MLKHTMTYDDFDGNKRTDTFYFNLTKLECLELDLGVEGGLEGYLNNLVEQQDFKSLVHEFKKIILASVGKKSSDSRQFIKNDEIRDSFAQTNAFVDLFMRMTTDTQFAIDFINQVIPQVKEDGSDAGSNVVQPILQP